MKKFLFSLILAVTLIFLAPFAFAVDQWNTANQVTLAWDPPTTLQDGSPIPADSTLKYRVYLKTNKGMQAVALTDQLQTTITFSEEGDYLLGVEVIRMVNGEIVGQSDLIWSDDPKYTLNGKTFGVRYFSPPGPVMNLKIP